MPVTFDEILLPVDFEGGSSGGPVFSTDVIRNPRSGIAQRNANRLDAIGRWRLNYATLSPENLAVLETFYRARFGRGRGFRFRAPNDYTATLEVFATGDGTVGPYQLYKSYTSAGSSDVRKIVKPVAGGLTYDTRVNTITIYKNDVAVAATVSSTTGLVTLGAVAAVGAILKWSGQFDTPVNFATDDPNFTFDAPAVSSWQIEVEEILPVELGL